MAATGYAADAQTLAQPGATAARSKVKLPVVLFLLAVVVPLTIDVGPLAMTGVRLLLLLMVVPMTLRLFSGAYGQIIATDYLFLLHIAWAGVALAVNNPDRVVANIGSTGIEFLGGYLLGRAYIRSREDMIAMIRALALVIICTLPLALVETLTGRPLILELIAKLPVIRGSAITYDEQRLGLDRVQFAFQTPIHYGLFCTLGFSLYFIGLKGVYSRAKRWSVSALIGLCVFLSLSSGALLPMILQIFMILWATVFARTRRRWLLLFGLFAVIYVTIDLLSNRDPIRVLMTYATFSPGNAYWRAAIAQYGMENIWANPIFGIGLNDWARPSWMHSPSVDNYWLLTGMRYGIPGFLTVACGYAFAVWRVARRDLGDDQELLQLRRAWVFTFAGLALTIYTVHIWAEVYSIVFFLMGAGMWLVSAVPGDGGVSEPTVLARHLAPTSRFGSPSRLQPALARKAERRVTAATRTVEPMRHTRFPQGPKPQD